MPENFMDSRKRKENRKNMVSKNKGKSKRVPSNNLMDTDYTSQNRILRKVN